MTQYFGAKGKETQLTNINQLYDFLSDNHIQMQAIDMQSLSGLASLISNNTKTKENNSDRQSNFSTPSFNNSHRQSNISYFHRMYNQGGADLTPQIQSCPLLYTGAKYYVMKSSDLESLQLSQKEGVWATTTGPTMKLKIAFQKAFQVILIFSVNASGGFQGYARMTSLPDPNLKPKVFQKTETSFPYDANFAVDWIIQDVTLPYKLLNGFPTNPLNDQMTVM